MAGDLTNVVAQRRAEAAVIERLGRVGVSAITQHRPLPAKHIGEYGRVLVIRAEQLETFGI